MAAVSVCIPTFNGQTHLRECLESVLSQTFQDIEVNILDDCSTDSTIDIAEEYRSLDSRISVIQNKSNLGLVGNWNNCIQKVQSDWIKFVFQDDLIAPGCVESMYAAGKSGASLVFCQRDFIFEEGTSDSKKQYYLQNKTLIDNLFAGHTAVPSSEFQRIVLNNIGRNFIGEPTVVMLNKSVFKKYGYFNPLLAISCDIEYWMRVGINEGVEYISDSLASFRVHEKSVSGQFMGRNDYRMNILDDIVILHEIIFNKHYRSVKKLAERKRLDIMKEFTKKAHWAYGLARRAAIDPQMPDDSLLTEWRSVASNLKGLSFFPLRHAVLRKFCM